MTNYRVLQNMKEINKFKFIAKRKYIIKTLLELFGNRDDII